ncbi:hypothetical protein AXF42_Ash012738 [Apostasia shenzhenica]|uniref:Uncharacterized protein n=1 Tax=Apostasia shenzhenica TaxID=1088818 RepID=A0A2I0AM08_9ASPA|nr:hypothetical protein AXF42_Ash012738 [Apostasia shenzhenica]
MSCSHNCGSCPIPLAFGSSPVSLDLPLSPSPGLSASQPQLSTSHPSQPLSRSGWPALRYNRRPLRYNRRPPATTVGLSATTVGLSALSPRPPLSAAAHRTHPQCLLELCPMFSLSTSLDFAGSLYWNCALGSIRIIRHKFIVSPWPHSEQPAIKAR